MKTNVIDLLADVFVSVVLEPSPEKAEEHVISRLRLEGISAIEIEKAFRWIYSFFNTDDSVYQHAPKTRFFSQEERQRLGTEGYFFVMELEAQGVLSPARREFLMDRVMALDTFRLTLKQVRWLVFVTLAHDKKHLAEIKWVESIILKEHQNSTALH
ncbi:MAG: DUF494 family protein [Gammaproteobacteria bacterium]|nr:DUF494 family protein [Gammaproteobacteria bacterium]